jgi:hypothetical protein
MPWMDDPGVSGKNHPEADHRGSRPGSIGANRISKPEMNGGSDVSNRKEAGQSDNMFRAHQKVDKRCFN